jgi:hypothetical protein
MSTPTQEHDFLDLNGRQVHAFAQHMANLGTTQMTELLVSMLKSGAWRDFHDGLGDYRFLPGEFDYFLTQQGVTRDEIMHGVRDLDTKVLLEEAMDERRTGEDGYRRPLADVRTAIPERPGRPILPFGYSKAEAKFLAGEGAGVAGRTREPLGQAVRRYRNSGGQTSRKPSETVPPLERVRRAALRLGDDDLAALLEAVKAEVNYRSRRSTP